MSITILGIESSCDDTSAAIVRDGYLLSNRIANQDVHIKFGGVVPELASRAHQQNIIPVVDLAMKEAGVQPNEISAVAFTPFTWKHGIAYFQKLSHDEICQHIKMKYVTNLASVFFLNYEKFQLKRVSLINLLQLCSRRLCRRRIFTHEFRIVQPLLKQRQILFLHNS